MDYWLSYIDEDLDQMVEIAKHAESVGFRGLALADHVVVPRRYGSIHPSGGPTPFDHCTDFPDPLVSAATVLASTTTLEVMTYVYVLPMREPFSVASQVATLDRLSGGRFRFGVGGFDGLLHKRKRFGVVLGFDHFQAFIVQTGGGSIVLLRIQGHGTS